MKRCSTSPIIREIQIKTTLRYHLTPIRMAKINNSGNKIHWWGCGKRANTFSQLVGMQTGAATLENSMEVPQKTKNRTTLQPSKCTTRYLFKGYRSADSKGHRHPNVDSSTIDNSQSTERAQMSINGWMDEEDVYLYMTDKIYIYIQSSSHIYRCVYICIHTHTMQYHSAIKKMKSCHLQQRGWN